MSRLYAIVDSLHKEASMLSGAGNLIMGNKATAAGGALGGLYGAYKGSQGEEGGLKGALMGGVQGALGGAAIGNVGARVAGSGAFKNYKDARTRLLDEAGVDQANRGFFSRNFGKGRKQIKDYKKQEYGTMFNRQNTPVQKVKDQIEAVVDKEGSSLMDAGSAMKEVDRLTQSHAMTNLSAARDKIIFGGIGATMGLGGGAKLIYDGSKAGQGMTDQQRMQNLRAQYQQTGQLDPRQQRMLTNMMAGKAQGSAAI